VACRFGSIIDPDPTMVVDAVYGAPTSSILMPLGTDIRRGDQVLNENSNRTWLVVGKKTADSNLATAERVLVREV
jgi:hypothetical protein